MANKIMRKVFLACAIIISIVYVSMYYDNGEYTNLLIHYILAA